MKKKFTALGAYIFAGGFTCGVRKHFNVLAHFEDGKYGTETALYNKIVPEVHTDPITWPLEKFKGKVDFLYGNPPCAPWSGAAAGRETHWSEDPRTNAVRRMVQLLEAWQPAVWAWESVRPTFIKGRPFVNEVAARGLELGYAATVLMVDGQYHGVAQVRRRLFLVLSKIDIPWTHGSHQHPVTVREALEDPFTSETFGNTFTNTEPKELVMMMKPGERFASAFDKLHPGAKQPGQRCIGRPGFLKFRLEWDQPSRVLLGGAHLFHPKKHRYITVEEAAALCGYPRQFKFMGSLSKQYAQVAQAVMPPVGEYLARMVRLGLEKKRYIKKPFYERVEILGDRVEREVLDHIVRMKDGLKLIRAPTKAVKVRVNGGVVKPTTPRGQGIGSYIRELLQDGKDTTEVLKLVKTRFPQSKATNADVSWNRRKLAGKE